MARTLPQLSGGTFLCDGGLETTLLFHQGVNLPHFAAFVLLDDEQGRKRLADYYASYLALCADTPGAGYLLDTPTWRANPDWAALLGLDGARLRAANLLGARTTCALRDEWAPRLSGPIVVGGIIGPRATATSPARPTARQRPPTTTHRRPRRSRRAVWTCCPP